MSDLQAPEHPEINTGDIIETIVSMRDDKQAANSMRFFKTGKGDYGEGDRFLGLKVPQTRLVVKHAKLQVPLPEIEQLLYSEWHEVRLAGFLLLTEEMKNALPKKKDKQQEHLIKDKAAIRQKITDFYLKHARQANNWDLVDMSCPKILGEYLLYPAPDGTMPDRGILDRLACSDCMWEQRIGVVTNWRLIKEGQCEDILRIAQGLLDHPHDLMHKAVGWMLREVGKKDTDLLISFLDNHYHEMPRTALRYAIEKFSEPERRYWLLRK